MKIKYTGNSTVRRIGRYTWDAGNNFLQDVREKELAADLLTYPRPEFEAVEEVSEEIVSFVEGGEERPLKKVSIRGALRHYSTAKPITTISKRRVRNELRR